MAEITTTEELDAYLAEHQELQAAIGGAQAVLRRLHQLEQRAGDDTTPAVGGVTKDELEQLHREIDRSLAEITDRAEKQATRVNALGKVVMVLAQQAGVDVAAIVGSS